MASSVAPGSDPKHKETLIESHNVIPAQAGIQFFNNLPKSWMIGHSAVEGLA
ncbi:MAG: hypothetical protein WDA70_06535 [Lysobacteraceae bacterium]